MATVRVSVRVRRRGFPVRSKSVPSPAPRLWRGTLPPGGRSGCQRPDPFGLVWTKHIIKFISSVAVAFLGQPKQYLGFEAIVA